MFERARTMRIRHLLLCTTTLLEIYHVHGHCIDIHSRIVSQGLHYVPGGTNPCTLCICDKGGPKWCKSVLCSPPQNCKSFQVGSSCCEFKCLDDILSTHDNYKETYDVALRFIASTVTAVLSISLLFFLYNRLKRNKSLQHHNHQHEEQRNLSNVGYITGNFGYNQHNMGYLGSGNNEMEIRYEETSTNFSLWKPPGNYFPPGEAPPPYEEAMRAAQNDLALHNIQNATTHNTLINSFSSAYPQEINPALIQCRHEEPTQHTATTLIRQTASNSTPIASTISGANEIPNISSNTHQYVNVRVQVQQHSQSHSHPESVASNKRHHHHHHHHHHQQQQQQHEPKHVAPAAASSSSACKSEVSYENITAIKGCNQRVDVLVDRPTSSGFSGKSTAYHKSRSRTIPATAEPLLPTASSTVNTILGAGGGGGVATSCPSASSYELVPHVPLNLHLLATHAPHAQPSPYSRYVNENYNKIKLSGDPYTSSARSHHHDAHKKNVHRTLPKNLRELLTNPEGLKQLSGTISTQHLHLPSLVTEQSHAPPKVSFSSCSSKMVPTIEVADTTTTNGSVRDKPKDPPTKSLLTYQSLSQDEEDYRSECENCKSVAAGGEDDEGEGMNETMSLQRRPLSESGYELSYRTSLTLPTNTRKPRVYPCTTNAREKWFTSMQQTSSEESD